DSSAGNETPAGAQHPTASVVTPPEVLKRVDAIFPLTAPETGVTAPGAAADRTVVLVVTVNVDGTVSDIAIAQSAEAPFDQAAVAAIQQWTFKPARRG
ncbi:MAG: TonB family protein, partial [Pseudomonadota bacterium]